MVQFVQILASFSGAAIVWTFAFILMRDFTKRRFSATLAIAFVFLCAVNIAPIVLMIPRNEDTLSLIHTLFLISSILTALSSIFIVLFVSLLKKNTITWWALLFAMIGFLLSMFAVVPGATELIIVPTSIGNIVMLEYIVPFGTSLLLFGYLGNLLASILVMIHIIQILHLRGEGCNKSLIKVFLFFFIFANVIFVALNIIKRNYPEIYGIDMLVWSLCLSIVLFTFRKNPGIFYMIPALVKFIIITTKTGLVISSYDCFQRMELEKERRPIFGGQLLHTISEILHNILPLESEITTISSSKGIVLFEHGQKYSIYLIVDAYSTLWSLLLKRFSNELDDQFGSFVDIQGYLSNKAPDLESSIIRSWEQFFPVKK